MRLSSLVTRAVAAGAVTGLALAGPAVAAGASPLTSSVPVVVGHVISGPVVDVGPSASSPVASGADTFVPAHGDATATAPVTRSGRPAATHGSADACIAAALLTGHDPKQCGGRAAASGSTTAATADGSTLLTDSLSRVGVCAGLALDRGMSADSCAAGGSRVTGGAEVADPGSAITPLDAKAVGDVLAENGLCDVVEQLGVSGVDACSVFAAAGVPAIGSGSPNGSGTDGNGDSNGNGNGPGSDGTAAGSMTDLCRGLAVVGGVDPAACTVNADARHSSAPHKAANPGRPGAHKSEQSDRSAANAAPAAAQLNADCASSIGSPVSAKPSSPFGDPTAAGLGTLGALAGLAMGLRRLRRPRLG